MKTSKTGDTVYLEIGIYYDKEKDHILLTTRDTTPTAITTINRDTTSKRGHPNLFDKLARILEQAGAPHPSVKPTPADETEAAVVEIMKAAATPLDRR